MTVRSSTRRGAGGVLYAKFIYNSIKQNEKEAKEKSKKQVTIDGNVQLWYGTSTVVYEVEALTADIV